MGPSMRLRVQSCFFVKPMKLRLQQRVVLTKTSITTKTAIKFRNRGSHLTKLSCIELCAGAGGAAIGLEQAGFDHVALVEIDRYACETLRMNRPNWNVIEKDLHFFEGDHFSDIDLLSAGVPCPPFSVAGKRLGWSDERNLFPEALRVAKECQPKAIFIENVRGLGGPKFAMYRRHIEVTLSKMGYRSYWKLLNAADFGVPQNRPRMMLVAMQRSLGIFEWPRARVVKKTVGEVLYSEMASLGWKKAGEWREIACGIAPTIVGGSKKHGGADLGPTASKIAWSMLGVDGHGVADEPPGPTFSGAPRLTVRMAATVQGFPPSWEFAGKKTPAYRQVGNALPPPLARSIATEIKRALLARTAKRR